MGEKEEPDYAEVWATLLAHYNISYREVGELTIPQIEVLLSRVDKHICLKAGIPWEEETEAKPPKLADIMQFCAAFG